MVNSKNQPTASKGTAVIGIYYPNGVLSEDTENMGISYVLDHLFYEALQANIADGRDCRVFGHTCYGYSGFQVLCPATKIDGTVERIENTLYNHPWPDHNLSEWFDLCKKSALATPAPIDNQYYARCIPNEPLADRISRRIGNIPSRENLCDWRTRYIQKDRVLCYISGESFVDASVEDGNVFRDSMLPTYSPNEIDLPKHLPWRRTNVIYSVPYLLTASNILASEAYCEIVRSRIASTVNLHGGRLCSVAFYPDYVPELRIHFHVNRKREFSTIQQLEHNLLDFGDITSKQINAIRMRLHAFYCSMYENPIAWNRFAGYNYMSGNRYDLRGLRDLGVYENQITQDSLNQVFTDIKVQEKRNIFMTAVR